MDIAVNYGTGRDTRKNCNLGCDVPASRSLLHGNGARLAIKRALCIKGRGHSAVRGASLHSAGAEPPDAAPKWERKPFRQ